MCMLGDFPDFGQESNGRIQLCSGQTELLTLDLADVQLFRQGFEDIVRQVNAKNCLLHLTGCTKLLLWLTDGVDLGLLRWNCRGRDGVATLPLAQLAAMLPQARSAGAERPADEFPAGLVSLNG